MFCEICLKRIKLKRSWHNYFLVNIHHLCERCFRRYPIVLRTAVIPIEKGLLYHHTLFETRRMVSPLAYMSFLKIFYLNFIRHHKQLTYLYFDEFTEADFETLDQLQLGDLYVVTLNQIKEKKENDYEI